MKELVEKIQTTGCNTDEACRIVELYIYCKKGVKTNIRNPDCAPTAIQRMHETSLLWRAYQFAAEYILYRWYYREDVIAHETKNTQKA